MFYIRDAWLRWQENLDIMMSNPKSPRSIAEKNQQENLWKSGVPLVEIYRGWIQEQRSGQIPPSQRPAEAWNSNTTVEETPCSLHSLESANWSRADCGEWWLEENPFQTMSILDIPSHVILRLVGGLFCSAEPVGVGTVGANLHVPMEKRHRNGLRTRCRIALSAVGVASSLEMFWTWYMSHDWLRCLDIRHIV